jgi:hypothetical protein
MRSLTAIVVAATVFHAASAVAEGPALAHFPSPDARFTDALGASDLAIEAMLNTARDGATRKAASKGSAQGKAFGTLFGSIRNNAGAGICGLVLVNGQFVFSCSPTGSYSLDTITDAQGLLGVFGFADGHFPYHTNVTGFGRWDITLNVASTTPPVQAQSTITFSITDGCNNGVSIDYKFYDVTNNLVWPSATTHYLTSAFDATYRHDLLCTTNAKVCYGARSAGFYWGIDVDGSKSCSECCIFCTQGNSLSRRLTC